MTHLHEEYGDFPTGSLPVFEGFEMVAHGNIIPARPNPQLPQQEIAQDTKEMILKAVGEECNKMLPFIAEKYNVSAALKDYIIVPVPVMFSDLPNRKGVGFPYEQLTAFNPQQKMLAYQTWKWAPTHQDHVNKDYTTAKGVILDAALRPDPRFHGNVHKLFLLHSFDRNRDKVLCNAILNRERTSYSMGAWLADYRCSLCNSSANAGGCEHVNPKVRAAMRYTDKGHLAYLKAENPVGFESSSVVIPAFSWADNPAFMTLPS